MAYTGAADHNQDRSCPRRPIPNGDQSCTYSDRTPSSDQTQNAPLNDNGMKSPLIEQHYHDPMSAPYNDYGAFRNSTPSLSAPPSYHTADAAQLDNCNNVDETPRAPPPAHLGDIENQLNEVGNSKDGRPPSYATCERPHQPQPPVKLQRRTYRRTLRRNPNNKPLATIGRFVVAVLRSIGRTTVAVCTIVLCEIFMAAPEAILLMLSFKKNVFNDHRSLILLACGLGIASVHFLFSYLYYRKVFGGKDLTGKWTILPQPWFVLLYLLSILYIMGASLIMVLAKAKDKSTG